MGMPKVRSGGFALTYKLVNFNKRWAVRCFHKPLADREKRYALISGYLKSSKSPILINVEYLPDEILVNGSRHPVTLMDWVDGDTLSQYLYKNASRPGKLTNLAGEFLLLIDELERLQIAHGDLSHLNIIIKNAKMILIDYDGLFVPSIQGWKSAELGNRNFQHPLRTSEHFDSNLDRFSEIVIYLALSGIALLPRLFNKYGAGAEGLLFNATDFLKPHESSLLRDLETISELKHLVEKFRSICLTEMRNVPGLRDLLSDRAISIPQAMPSILSSLEAQSTPILFDASNKSVLLEKVGEFITVVGQITNIYQGVAINQKPYVFINFGDFREGCFTVVLWSEALALLKEAGKAPNDYSNQWVSVTGTITTYGGRSNTRPQIVLDSPADIQVMTKEEALGKLGYSDFSYIKKEDTISTTEPVSSTTVTTSSRDKDKLSQLYSKPKSNIQPSKSRSATKLVEKTKKSDANISPAQQHGSASSKSFRTSVQKKLDHLYSHGNISPTQSSKPKAIPSKPLPKKTSKPSIDIAPWIWWAGALVLIYLFFSSTVNKAPQVVATSTPRPRATATLRREPTLSAFQVAATENTECAKWNEINTIHKGKRKCVYGIFDNNRKIITTSDSWFLIRFDPSPATFYVISENTLQVENGDCIVAKSIVNYDTNGIPYMNVTEISIEKNRCEN